MEEPIADGRILLDHIFFLEIACQNFWSIHLSRYKDQQLAPVTQLGILTPGQVITIAIHKKEIMNKKHKLFIEFPFIFLIFEDMLSAENRAFKFKVSILSPI